jgi:hypothetical protein
MPWLLAALDRIRQPATLRSARYADVYGWHLPHYAYGSDRADCQTCTTTYPCRVVRQRARRGGDRS